jgi:hypothetical protein
MQLGKQIKRTLISVSSNTTSDSLLACPCRTEISFRDYLRNALARRRRHSRFKLNDKLSFRRSNDALTRALSRTVSASIF